jgi:ABC-type spermidine/putrescine transport system permease subunit I
VHTLIDQLADADENVSTAARDALVKLGDAAFAPLIEAIDSLALGGMLAGCVLTVVVTVGSDCPGLRWFSCRDRG